MGCSCVWYSIERHCQLLGERKASTTVAQLCTSAAVAVPPFVSALCKFDQALSNNNDDVRNAGRIFFDVFVCSILYCLYFDQDLYFKINDVILNLVYSNAPGSDKFESSLLESPSKPNKLFFISSRTSNSLRL